MLLLALLASSLTVDGEAALRHASALAALGPHPFGSPRARIAAEYVAVQFRASGLGEVRFQDVESGTAQGANVIGVLRAPGPEVLMVAAHHDTVPDSPGARASGGSVGVLIEAARALAQRAERPRTIVFASLDGREPVLGGRSSLGARAYVQSLGREARSIVAALVLDRCGRKEGTPVLETPAYADPLRPGETLVAPAFLVRAALDGARAATEPLAVGDPVWSWVYQAGVRTFRITDQGDDRPFAEAGLPALRVSDRRFFAADPSDRGPSDTADRLDALALARVGRVLLGAVAVVESASRPATPEPDWFGRLGQVVGRGTLLAAGAASLIPALFVAPRAAGLGFGLRIVHATLFSVLLWRQPVIAAFVFLLPNVLSAFARRWWLVLLGLVPALSLLLFGIVAWSRGLVRGVFPAPWELAVAGFVLALTVVRPSQARGKRNRGQPGKKSLPKR